MAAPALSEPHDAPDSLATVGAWKRLVAAGFTRSVRDDWLIAAPADRLTDAQRTYLKWHQITLVEPLHDTETLRNALSDAGAAGLDWREGKPPDCADERRLAAGEVQYGDGRRVNRNARRYACQGAPCAESLPRGHTLTEPAARPATAVAEAPSPDTDPLAVRANELRAEGRARGSLEARAPTEAPP